MISLKIIVFTGKFKGNSNILLFEVILLPLPILARIETYFTVKVSDAAIVLIIFKVR